jgi:HSP20 family protein
VLQPDAAGFADEVDEIFAELGRGSPAVSGECSPAIDVFETESAVTITVDLPDVDRSRIRVVCKDRAVLIAGEKAPRRAHGESAFHLVERGFGRFARTVLLTTPCDTRRAAATVTNGELRVVVPKIADRRRIVITVPIT